MKIEQIHLKNFRGFKEVRSRNAQGPIEIEIKFRPKTIKQLVTYTLSISEQNGKTVVEREVLKYRRGSRGQPWHFLDFSKGKGVAVTNELDKVEEESDLKREEQKLKSPDILAIKGLAQFERFPAVVALGNLIERWLYDPNPHLLLCVEEPENQLHPRLLNEIAEEFRSYSNRGGQVFVSTSS